MNINKSLIIASLLSLSPLTNVYAYNFTGTPGDDVILGTDQDDVINNGGGGVDIIDGAGGNDDVTGTWIGENSQFNGGDGNDTLDLSGADFFKAYGDAGDDLFISHVIGKGVEGDRSYFFDGGEGNDTFEIGSSAINNLTWNMETGEALLQESASTFVNFESFTANMGFNYNITGTDGDNYISVQGGNSGQIGVDTLDGANGNDTIEVGGYNTATIIGNNGSDEYLILKKPGASHGSYYQTTVNECVGSDGSIDTLIFSATESVVGITQAAKVESNLVISTAGNNYGDIILKDVYADPNCQVEEITFTDASYTYEEFLSKYEKRFTPIDLVYTASSNPEDIELIHDDDVITQWVSEVLPASGEGVRVIYVTISGANGEKFFYDDMSGFNVTNVSSLTCKFYYNDNYYTASSGGYIEEDQEFECNGATSETNDGFEKVVLEFHDYNLIDTLIPVGIGEITILQKQTN